MTRDLTPFEHALADARERAARSIAPLLVGTILALLVMLLASVLVAFLAVLLDLEFDPTASIATQWLDEILFAAGVIALASTAIANLARMAIEHTPDTPVNASRVFHGGILPKGRTTGAVVLAFLLPNALMPPAALLTRAEASGDWTLIYLLLAASLVVTAFTMYVLPHHVHTGAGPMESLRVSLDLTTANLGTTVKLMIRFLVYGFFTVLTVGIAAIWLYPAALRLWTSTYLAVHGDLPRDALANLELTRDDTLNGRGPNA